MRMMLCFCLIPFGAFAQTFEGGGSSDSFGSGVLNLDIFNRNILGFGMGDRPDAVVFPDIVIPPVQETEEIENIIQTETSTLVCNEPRCEADVTLEGCECEYLVQ